MSLDLVYNPGLSVQPDWVTVYTGSMTSATGLVKAALQQRRFDSGRRAASWPYWPHGLYDRRAETRPCARGAAASDRASWHEASQDSTRYALRKAINFARGLRGADGRSIRCGGRALWQPCVRVMSRRCSWLVDTTGINWNDRLIIASVPRCLGASVPRCLGASVPRCLGASVPRCLGASVPRSSTIR